MLGKCLLILNGITIPLTDQFPFYGRGGGVENCLGAFPNQTPK